MKRNFIFLLDFFGARKIVKKKKVKRKVKPYFVLLPICSSLIKRDLETKGVIL